MENDDGDSGDNYHEDSVRVVDAVSWSVTKSKWKTRVSRWRIRDCKRQEMPATKGQPRTETSEQATRRGSTLRRSQLSGFSLFVGKRRKKNGHSLKRGRDIPSR